MSIANAALGETTGSGSVVQSVNQIDVNTAKALREQRKALRNQLLFEEEGCIKVTYGSITVISTTRGWCVK